MIPKKYFVFYFILNSLLLTAIWTKEVSASSTAQLKPLPDLNLNKIISKLAPEKSEVGLSLVDLDSNDLAYGLNEKEIYTPASVQKILTAIFALNVLGPEHQFSTILYSDGEKKGQTLFGNLYLKGGGDPFVKLTDLYHFIQRLKELGINKIEGKLIYDEEALITSTSLSDEVPFDHTYNTGISALSIEFNQITLTRDAEKNFVTIPDFDYIKFQDFSGKIPLDMKYYPEFKDAPETETWYFSKNKGYQLFEELPVRHPGKIFAEHFKKMAAIHGIEIHQTQKGIVSLKAQKIYEHKGLPLKILTQWMLEYSNNLFAELILLNAAKKYHNNKLDLVSSTDVMKNWFTQKVPSDLWRNCFIYNGSGLSGKSKISPELLSLILAASYKEKIRNVEFLTYLSVSGISGWIKNKLNSKNLATNVWAKTGTMDYVSTLAGYLFTKKGKRYAFSLLLQKNEARKILDVRTSDNERQINRLSQGAASWRLQALELQQAVLEHWAQNY